MPHSDTERFVIAGRLLECFHHCLCRRKCVRVYSGAATYYASANDFPPRDALVVRGLVLDVHEFVNDLGDYGRQGRINNTSTVDIGELEHSWEETTDRRAIFLVTIDLDRLGADNFVLDIARKDSCDGQQMSLNA